MYGLLISEVKHFSITTQSNTTITHYYPIEESINSINDFIVGAPVYLTGKVFKYSDNKFVLNTENYTTECICSVKTNGKWIEFVGICVKIDALHSLRKEITLRKLKIHHVIELEMKFL